MLPEHGNGGVGSIPLAALDGYSESYPVYHIVHSHFYEFGVSDSPASRKQLNRVTRKGSDSRYLYYACRNHDANLILPRITEYRVAEVIPFIVQHTEISRE